MNTENPIISIVIPVYNCEKYIDDAIQSALSQKHNPTEIIIVDDGSTDNSGSIIKNYTVNNIEYIYQNNSGPAAARNIGIKIAKGEFIAFLDADDLWPEDKLTLQLSNFENDSELEVCVGRIKYAELPGAKKNNRIPLDSNDTFKYVNLGAGLYKKDVFDKIGYFDENFIFWEDLDWFLRAYEKRISIKFIEYVTMIYRIHSDNMSNNSNDSTHYFNKAIRNSLNRRKKIDESIQPINNFFELNNPKTRN